DLGVLYKLNEYVSLGLMQQNTLPSSAGGKLTWSTGKEEGIPSRTIAGVGVKLLQQKLLMDLDYELRPGNSKQSGAAHLGAEFWPIQYLALRAGLDQEPAATGAGETGTITNWTAGVGLRFKGFEFDYAYRAFDSVANLGTHYFSLSFNADDINWAGNNDNNNEIITHRITSKEPTAKRRTFIDVPEGYWAKDNIERIAGLGIIDGYPDGTFRPQGTVSRAELVTVLVRAKGGQASGYSNSSFKDVPPGNWAASYIDQGVSAGWIKGYPGGKFKPFTKLNREEGVTAMARFAELTPPPFGTPDPFPDIGENHWAYPYIASAKQAGMLGYISGNFNPSIPLSRAEVVEILSNTDFIQNKFKTAYAE
ncbi:MAG: S-layer homology domain-containing protein, partial [bacterium]